MPKSPIRRSIAIPALGLVVTMLAGCDDMGPYHPAAHHEDEASTGSMLSGTDTGAAADKYGMTGPSVHSAGATAAGH